MTHPDSTQVTNKLNKCVHAFQTKCLMFDLIGLNVFFIENLHEMQVILCYLGLLMLCISYVRKCYYIQQCSQ